MKIEIRETTKKGVVQITTLDERWYYNQEKKIFRPSSSWISSYYPKGVEFYKWLASKGWNEAEAIKIAAGNRGSKVHQAIEVVSKGNKIAMADKFLNGDTGLPEELAVEEWECVMSFVSWFTKYRPTILALEQTVENDQYNYAGTLDLKCKIGNDICIVDYKTSANLFPYMDIQLSSYKHADGNEDVKRQFILQLNYKKNKDRYKFTEVEDKFPLFLAARQIWHNENKDVHPKQKDYPTELVIPGLKEQIEKATTLGLSEIKTKVEVKIINKAKPAKKAKKHGNRINRTKARGSKSGVGKTPKSNSKGGSKDAGRRIESNGVSGQDQKPSEAVGGFPDFPS